MAGRAPQRRHRRINWFGIIFWLLILIIIVCSILLIANNRADKKDDTDIPTEDVTQNENTEPEDTTPEITNPEDSLGITPNNPTEEEPVENEPVEEEEVVEEEPEEEEEVVEEEPEEEEEVVEEEPEDTTPPPTAGVENPEEYTSTRALVVANAKSAIGVAEGYGGTGPDSFDITGLVYFCFAESGVSAPRRFSEQAAYGTEVSRDELLPGDVVFFYSETEGEPEYLGIYTGDGNFVAVSSSRGEVCEMSLYSDYFSQRFLFGRRYCD